MKIEDDTRKPEILACKWYESDLLVQRLILAGQTMMDFSHVNSYQRQIHRTDYATSPSDVYSHGSLDSV